MIIEIGLAVVWLLCGVLALGICVSAALGDTMHERAREKKLREERDGVRRYGNGWRAP